ncbi:ABC transporter permease [Cupriavidus pampae]|uniref:Pyoverdine export ATP-binding/permease protein PvdT n=1 Tax=Cupriavidus pampae TaxID=659251 RepID=A0ABM8WA83_9BURK|nr:ABC transporter permease [Cupriavidus pampae]CAG9164166.1 Macrolide export ATP-binding/permease protein MacB [Cupriavidus pampae]
MTQALLELRAVSRAYRMASDRADGAGGSAWTTALHAIDLDIRAGEMVAIIGHSGSGKTTLLNLLGCLDRPTGGTYRIGGRDTRLLDADALAALRRDTFGFVFQRYDLLPALTALENVEMPAVYAGVKADVRRERACHLLRRFGLGPRLGHFPSQLSGGQQQRVSIARALINGGSVILADEPTGALDRASHEEVLAHLRALHREGHTIVIVTHDPAVAAVAERVVELRDGRVVSDRRVTGERATGSARVEASRPARGDAAAALQRLRVSLAMAWRAMLSHRLRAVLTMLGIVMGIAAVILVTGLGEGAKRRVVDDLRAFGAHTVDVYPGKDWNDDDAAGRRALGESDLPLLAIQPYTDSISPVVAGSAAVRVGSRTVRVTLSGVGAQYFRASGAAMSAGTAFSASDVFRQAQVIIIDATLARRLFGPERDPIGETVLVDQVPCRVIGVARTRKALFAPEPAPEAWLPYTTQMYRFQARDYFDAIKIRLKPGQGAWPPRDLERILTRLHGRKDFFVMVSDHFVKKVEATARTLTLLVSGVAVIALVVGGVGVMNIMLVAVSERTREIGIRMALGARRSDIQQQFLIEAVLLCMTGALAGVAFAWCVGMVIGWMQSEISMVFSPWAIAGACGTAIAVGIGFGYVPARNAARLVPVVALARG